MSIELLDKTRKINRLLNDRLSSKVAFSDICSVLGQLLNSAAYIISNKGKILGSYQMGEAEQLGGFQNKRGVFVDSQMNERFLGVLSTKENANLEILGFDRKEASGYCAMITPISIRGDRLGTLFLYRKGNLYGIEDIILCEYSTTVVGLEIIRSDQEKLDKEANKKKNLTSALETLTPLECTAVSCVIHELNGKEDTLVTSQVAKKYGITRTVMVNALRKLVSAGLIRTKSSGVKGTHIEIINDIVYTEFDN
ncbi:MAG: GTP-sensing pleiotropic transcriptional regulator CodY [Eubacterium sp.]|nr:GTP-sensing pleiotropic transcriptional regulator CodY [Eubacterium sp.]